MLILILPLFWLVAEWCCLISQQIESSSFAFLPLLQDTSQARGGNIHQSWCSSSSKETCLAPFIISSLQSLEPGWATPVLVLFSVTPEAFPKIISPKLWIRYIIYTHPTPIQGKHYYCFSGYVTVTFSLWPSEVNFVNSANSDYKKVAHPWTRLLDLRLKFMCALKEHSVVLRQLGLPSFLRLPIWGLECFSSQKCYEQFNKHQKALCTFLKS